MRKLTLLALVLVSLAGCASDADRRLLVIHECKLLLRHSVTEPKWTARRAECEARILLEDPDTMGGK